jgi:hypothetical protein
MPQFALTAAPRARLALRTVATAFLLASPLLRVYAQTLRDDFGDDERPHAAKWDYATGEVPPKSIWAGVHNAINGGDADNAGLVIADGVDTRGKPRPGRLYIEDLGLHQHAAHDPPKKPLLGVGWEPQDSKTNNAPFLYTLVAADKDFDVVIKSTAQFAGRWSYLAVIVRVAGPAVGFGTGEPFDSTESFVTVGSFRPASGNSEEASLLLQNTINGSVGSDDVYCDLAPEGPSGALPIWIRLSKRGGNISAASSVNGVDWLEPSNAKVTNHELDVPGTMLEVGLSYMRFNNPEILDGARPAAVIDFFELTFSQGSQPNLVFWSSVVALLFGAIVTATIYFRRNNV